jgi:hypothetical protein
MIPGATCPGNEPDFKMSVTLWSTTIFTDVVRPTSIGDK